MSQASQNGEGVQSRAILSDLAEEDVEGFDTVESSLDSDSDEEESSKSIFDYLDRAEDVFYVGSSPDKVEANGSFVPVGAWEEGVYDPMDVEGAARNSGAESLVYVVDGSMAETLAAEDWTTERNPGKVFEEKGREEAAEIVNSAYDVVEGWSGSIADTDEVSGVVVRNDCHGNELYKPPVKFDFDRRNNGGEDSVYRALIGRFVHNLKSRGWSIEYAEVTDDRMEIYMEP